MDRSRRRKAVPLSRAPSEVKGFKVSAIGDKSLKQSEHFFRWSLNIVYTSGKWGLTDDVLKNKWCPNNGLRKALLNRESMTWAELANQVGGPNRGTNNHHVPVSKIRSEAQELLKKSSLDDLDEIYSLRIKGKERLYGIIQDYVLYILWYDPKHEIYSTKNT